jgi:hypothetical protein
MASSAIASPKKLRYYFASPLGVELRPIFDNQHSAISAQHSAKQFATLCRPDSKDRKTGLKLSRIGAMKNGGTRTSTAF